MKKEKKWAVYFESFGLKKKITGRLARLYPMENPDRLFYFFLEKWLKQLLLIMMAVILLVVLFLISNGEEPVLQEGNVLYRPGYNESEQEVSIKAEVESTKNPEEITLQIEPEKYTLEEFEQMVREAVPEVEKTILGTNLSLEEITDNLVLPENLDGTPIEIFWESDNEEVINREGAVNLEMVPEEGTLVVLTAVFTYEDYKMSHGIGLFVEPQKLSEEMRLRRLLLSEIEAVFENSESSSQIQLPSEIEGKKVFYEEEKQEKKGVFALFFLMGVLIWILVIKEEMEGQEKKREKQLLMDYPELISQFSLLLRAGMTVSGTWKRLIDQYEIHQKKNKKERRYVYEEMTITWREIQNGVSEVEAISRFGSRIKLTPYLKFASLLTQNIRKGSRGLIDLLQAEGKIAYEERKETAKQLGEEAGTKLLLPMIMMLGIVLVIILVPAFLSF